MALRRFDSVRSFIGFHFYWSMERDYINRSIDLKNRRIGQFRSSRERECHGPSEDLRILRHWHSRTIVSRVLIATLALPLRSNPMHALVVKSAAARYVSECVENARGDRAISLSQVPSQHPRLRMPPERIRSSTRWRSLFRAREIDQWIVFSDF